MSSLGRTRWGELAMGRNRYHLTPKGRLLNKYFHLGYTNTYDVIVSFMGSRHDICMDVQTLKRSLVRYKLSRNESWRNEVKNLIKEEMLWSGSLAGYRKMWHLRLVNRIVWLTVSNAFFKSIKYTTTKFIIINGLVNRSSDRNKSMGSQKFFSETKLKWIKYF